MIYILTLCFIQKANRTNSTFGFFADTTANAKKTKRAVLPLPKLKDIYHYSIHNYIVKG